MAGFQAVDLDSILDEFESEQNEAEKDNESSNASKSEVEDSVSYTSIFQALQYLS